MDSPFCNFVVSGRHKPTFWCFAFMKAANGEIVTLVWHQKCTSLKRWLLRLSILSHSQSWSSRPESMNGRTWKHSFSPAQSYVQWPLTSQVFPQNWPSSLVIKISLPLGLQQQFVTRLCMQIEEVSDSLRAKLQLSATQCKSFSLRNREPDLSGYKYFMETNTSSSQRIEDDRITYLNKGRHSSSQWELQLDWSSLHYQQCSISQHSAGKRTKLMEECFWRAPRHDYL